MAKEFKNFDKMFTKALIFETRVTYAALQPLMKWPYALAKDPWDHEYIRFCVYESSTSERWQLFRVSLKGLETGWKLAQLEHYCIKHFVGNTFWYEAKIEKCRIDNYIGALRRGGQLNENYEVAK